MNNALKHSTAEEVSVIVREEAEGTKLLFLISDDGKGFSNEEVENAYNELTDAGENTILNESTHLGIRGMKNRAEILGARLEIKTDSETGTQVKLVLPL